MEGIKDTIFKFLRIDNLADNLTGYVETRIKLLKIEIKEDVTRVLSRGLVQSTLIFFGFLFLIFFSIGLAEYINTFFLNSFEGYWIVSAIYFAFFLIFLAFRKNINRKFEKYFSELINRREDNES